jgi:hypothetical protein
MILSFSPGINYGLLIRAPHQCHFVVAQPMQCELTPTTWTDSSLMTIQFARAASAANTANPEPGQCAWLDRPLLQGEGSSLTMELKGSARDSYLVPRFRAQGGANFRFEGMSGAGGSDATNPTLMQFNVILAAMDTGGLFTVYAFNAGYGLRISAVSLDANGPN